MVQDNATPKRWEIAVCEKGTVHVHYGTGSLHIMREDFVGLAREMQKVADSLEPPMSVGKFQRDKQLLQ